MVKYSSLYDNTQTDHLIQWTVARMAGTNYTIQNYGLGSFDLGGSLDALVAAPASQKLEVCYIIMIIAFPLTSRHSLFTLPCCQIYRYPCTVH